MSPHGHDIRELAEDVDTARRLLHEAPNCDARDAGGRLLRAIALAPSLGNVALRELRACSMSSQTRALARLYVDAPLALQTIYDIANQLSEESYFAEALVFWERYVRVAHFWDSDANRTAPIHHEIGYCLTALNRHEDALPHFVAAALCKPDYLALSCIAHTMLELGRMGEATRAFRASMARALHPAEFMQALPFVAGAERLEEFEGQQGGLDARDLHYVHTAGLLLELAGEEKHRLSGRGYFGGVAASYTQVSTALARLEHVLTTFEHRPSCVVPFSDRATPLSLAIADLLEVPHFSHVRGNAWDRPLLVVDWMEPERTATWGDFLSKLSSGPLTFAYALDWKAERLPIVDVTGRLMSSCRFPWETEANVTPHQAAQRLVAHARERSQAADEANARLAAYYERHGGHRLGQAVDRGEGEDDGGT